MSGGYLIHADAGSLPGSQESAGHCLVAPGAEYPVFQRACRSSSTPSTRSQNKVILVDGGTVIIGSYNFSANAEKNAENLLIIRHADLAVAYAANFEEHLAHAEKYKGLGRR